MSEHLRDRLLEEMAASHRPPVDGVVAGAVQRGRRQRRTRRVVAGAGTTAVVGVTVLAVGIGASFAPHHAARSTGIDAGASGSVTAPAVVATTVKAVATTAAPAPSTAAAKATPAATSESSKDGKLAAAHTWRDLQAAKSAANPPHWTDAPAGVPVTPQGELQLFKELAAPYGTLSDPGVSEDVNEAEGTHVRANLTTPDGKVGEVQF